MRNGYRGATAFVAAVMMAGPTSAEQRTSALEPFAPPAIAVERYDHAARLLSASEQRLVRNVDVAPNWTRDGDRFWYRKELADGAIFELVDAGSLTREPAFDHARVADALARASGQSVSPRALPFRSFTYGADGRTIMFDAFGKAWTCSTEDASCTLTPPRFAPNQAVAPDTMKAVFRRDRNLWISTADGRERALTTDGIAFNEYGFVSGNSQLYVAIEEIPGGIPPALSWSPGSTRFLTHRIDETRVGEMSLWQGAPADGSFRPKVTTFKQSQPGDGNPPVTSYMIFDAESGARVYAKGMAADLVVDPLGGLGSSGPSIAEWSPDSRYVYVLARDRRHKKAGLFRIDAATGETSPVVQESSSTYVSLDGSYAGGLGVVMKFLHQRRELLWFSERDGWGHLYRYDLATGKLLNQVTSGPWVVSRIVDIDEEKGVVYFQGAGREKGRNPYLNSLYRVNLDGSDLKLLTPEDADHGVHTATFGSAGGSKISPSKRYVVDSYSRVDTVPTSVLRSTETGDILMTIETADASALDSLGGWKKPVPFTVKGRDGKTDMFGTMYLPSNFDPAKTYPVIDQVYPAAHFIVPDVQAFSMGYFFRQALADLGFIVVNMDGFGTPGRGKAFHDFSYGNLQDGPGLEDHVTGIRDLARSYPQIDLDRVGVVGHSSGGYGTALAMLKFPDFYKVGVASAPAVNMCGSVPMALEKWQGVTRAEDKDCEAVLLAKMAPNLRGKLLLAYGDMDEHVPSSTIIHLVDALTKANRDYDLLVMPNHKHGFGFDPYFRRRMFDYLVRNLMGSTPPLNASLALPAAPR